MNVYCTYVKACTKWQATTQMTLLKCIESLLVATNVINLKGK